LTKRNYDRRPKREARGKINREFIVPSSERERVIKKLYGTLGPVSEVRKIDPKTGKEIKDGN